MDDTTDLVGMLVSVPRDLRRRLKVEACRRDVTMNGFAVAALDFVTSNPDVLTVLETEDD